MYVLGSTKVKDLESAIRLDFICQRALRAWARNPVCFCAKDSTLES